MEKNNSEDSLSGDSGSPGDKKVVLETILEVEEEVLEKLEKSKFPNSVHENAQRTEIIIAKKMKVEVIKDRIEEIDKG